MCSNCKKCLHHKQKEYLNTVSKMIRASVPILKMYILNTPVISEANILL